MPREIERKFLVINDSWKHDVNTTRKIEQGYFMLPPKENYEEQKEEPNAAIKSSIRVRTMDKEAFITIKSLELGMSRDEFEYPIPYQEARYMLENLCVHSTIKKQRHFIKHQHHDWIIDEFLGAHHPLVMAEIELQSENEHISIPNWIGQEVTHQIQYYNTSLIYS